MLVRTVFLSTLTGLSLSACRASHKQLQGEGSSSVAETSELSPSPSNDAPGALADGGVSEQMKCGREDQTVVLGLAPSDDARKVTAAALGLPADLHVVPAAHRLPGARLIGCKSPDGKLRRASIYLRSMTARGAAAHFSLVLDPEIKNTVEDVASGMQLAPISPPDLDALNRLFSNGADQTNLRLLFGDTEYPSSLVMKSIPVDGQHFLAMWIESADGTGKANVRLPPIVGALSKGDPFEMDRVCAYGWLRTARRYALDSVTIELDACEMTHELISGGPLRSFTIRAMKITDPRPNGEPTAQRGLVFASESTVASVSTLIAGDKEGCDELDIILTGAEYWLLVRADPEKPGTCEKDMAVTGRKDKRPKDAVGSFEFRTEEKAETGWARALPTTVPLQLGL